MYNTMAVWETDAALAAQSDLMSDFANVWQAADKVVYSTTLAAVSTAGTRLERHFDPGAVHDLKAAARSDLPWHRWLQEFRVANAPVRRYRSPL
jgi:hypothetical protein